MDSIIFSAIEQSILFFPLALSVYVSYVILRTTDMTTEGSVVLGAGVFARLLSLDYSIGISVAMSTLAGILSGLGVSLIQTGGKIHSLVAGIIGLFILYSINFKIMGKPNIGIYNTDMPFLIIVMVVALLTLSLTLIMSSKTGLVLRAFGSNPQLLKNLGKSIEWYRILGLSMSNALAALCGAMTAKVNGYADLQMGFGMTLTAISTIMIGQQFILRLFNHFSSHSFNIGKELISCFLGVFIYFIFISTLLYFGIDAVYLKLVLGLTLITLLRKGLS